MGYIAGMAPLTQAQRSEIWLTNIDTSDCGVIALQAVTGWSRKRAERELRKYGGYPSKETGGTPRGGIELALAANGVETESYPWAKTDTVATFALRHDYGRFLIYVTHERNGERSGHVMALVDGDLPNSKGSWHDSPDQVTRVL